MTISVETSCCGKPMVALGELDCCGHEPGFGKPLEINETTVRFMERATTTRMFPPACRPMLVSARRDSITGLNLDPAVCTKILHGNAERLIG